MKKDLVWGAVALLSCVAGTASTAAAVDTAYERGAYLMKSVVACGNCHTPRAGPFAGMELAGGFKWDEPPFLVYSPNITPDRETGLGAWSDGQITLAIREGKRPNGGRIIGPPMPIHFYRNMSDNDVTAIVAYLRSVKPVKNTVPEAVYRITLPASYGPPVGHVPDVPRTDKVRYGKYLADIGHCMECHTPMEKGRLNLAMVGAGGRIFGGPWGESVSANLTPDRETGIGNWTDGQIKQAITHGVRPDGTKLRPPMAFDYYRNIRDEDLDAIVAYLRTLKPIAHEVR